MNILDFVVILLSMFVGYLMGQNWTLKKWSHTTELRLAILEGQADNHMRILDDIRGRSSR